MDIEEPMRKEPEDDLPERGRVLQKESFSIRSKVTIKRKRGRPSQKPIIVKREMDEEPEDKDFRRILSPNTRHSCENSKVDWILQ